MGQIRLFRGIYPDFAAASKDIPRARLRGYDNEQSAQRSAIDRGRIFPFDYPIMFWLCKLLPPCKLLFDWGGNVGVSYYAYRRYLSYPQSLQWLVCDLPASTALGERIATEEAVSTLQFTNSLDRIDRADILLAAGSLHFIEDPFQPLYAAKALPGHILLNKVPIYDLASAVTLHNMGSAFCPYHLFNRNEFLGRFLNLGYDLVDEWQSPDLGCDIPFFPEHSISAYSGFYFAKNSAMISKL